MREFTKKKKCSKDSHPLFLVLLALLLVLVHCHFSLLPPCSLFRPQTAPVVSSCLSASAQRAPCPAAALPAAAAAVAALGNGGSVAAPRGWRRKGPLGEPAEFHWKPWRRIDGGILPSEANDCLVQFIYLGVKNDPNTINNTERNVEL